MPERRRRYERESCIEFESEELGFILEPKQVEIGSGYSVSISYDENEKPTIEVKTYGEVDVPKMRREIKRMFPNVQIRQLVQAGSVAVVKKPRRKRSTKKEQP